LQRAYCRCIDKSERQIHGSELAVRASPLKGRSETAEGNDTADQNEATSRTMVAKCNKESACIFSITLAR
jgi:hypothetical protein